MTGPRGGGGQESKGGYSRSRGPHGHQHWDGKCSAVMELQQRERSLTDTALLHLSCRSVFHHREGGSELTAGRWRSENAVMGVCGERDKATGTGRPSDHSPWKNSAGSPAREGPDGSEGRWTKASLTSSGLRSAYEPRNQAGQRRGGGYQQKGFDHVPK